MMQNKLMKIIALVIGIIMGILAYRLFIRQREGFTENKQSIPKIIHQTAPADKSKWHKEWAQCQESWKRQFPDFEYKMWTDEDNLKLIETDYPWFLDTYKKYSKNIMRFDIIRYFILDKYGGIYADMDYMCIKNFYDKLNPGKVSISESPYTFNEYLQNALMCSPKGHSFWMKVITKSKARMDKNDNTEHVLYISGPQLVSHTYEENKNDVDVLPIKEYNPDKNSKEFNEHDKIYTKHFGTATWV